MAVDGFLTRFFAPLAALTPPLPIELAGQWSTSTRRTYATAKQLGSGVGPFVTVTDARWDGRLESAVPLAGLLLSWSPRAGEARWVKSPPAGITPLVSVHLAAAGLAPRGAASFGVLFHGATLPSVPVPSWDEARHASAPGHPYGKTGRLHLIAEAGGTSFIVVPLQQAMLKVGRNGLWRVRDEVAGALPEPLRTMMTRRRTGYLAATG